MVPDLSQGLIQVGQQIATAQGYIVNIIQILVQLILVLNIKK